MDETVASSDPELSNESVDEAGADLSDKESRKSHKKPHKNAVLPHHWVPKLPYGLGGDDSNDPVFRDHVNNLRGTMFYVCQGSCLCGTVNNRGKVIYCYGDLVPRHGELFAEGGETSNTTSSKDLLAAQLGVWAFGIIALLVVLLLIRKSLASLKRHVVKVTERLPFYHDDDLISNHSATSPPLHGKDTTMDTMKKDKH